MKSGPYGSSESSLCLRLDDQTGNSDHIDILINGAGSIV